MSNVVYNTNTPAFHQGADIELGPGDEKKRLIILLFHMDANKNCNEFIGCMSFGLRHLKSKSKRKAGVEGWYYLLSKELGFRKHLSAADNAKSIAAAGSLDSRLASSDGATNAHPSDLTHANLSRKRIQGLESRTLVIYKKNQGYGFTVKNTCPVRVGRVKPSGPSEEAGLLKGDYINRINGQNVSMASAQAVAEIVRRSAKFLIVDIWRLPAKVRSRSSEPRCSPNSQAYSTVSDSEMSTKVDVQSTNNNCPSDSQNGGPQARCAGSTESFHQSGQSANAFYRASGIRSDSKRNSQSGVEVADSSQSLGSEQSDDENIPPIGCSDLTYKSQPRMKPLGKHRLNDSGECVQRKSGHYGLDHRLDYDESIGSSGKSIDSRRSFSGGLPSGADESLPGDAVCARKMRADGNSDSERTKWDPEISVIEASDALPHYVSSYCDLDLSDVDGRRSRPPPTTAGSVTWPDRSSTSGSQGSPYRRRGADESVFWSEDQRVVESSDEILDKAMLPGYSSIEDSALGSSHSSTKSTSDEGGATGGDVIKAAILTLVGAERDFARLMQHGIQQYSRPLRHGLLKPEQHIKVFQNIEKLVALSEYNIHQFEESYSAVSAHNPLLTDNLIAEEIADIYSTRVRLLCNTYKTYLDGLPAASQALQNLYSNRNIRKFLHSQRLSNFTVEHFLEQPKQHLLKLIENFTDVVKLLKPQSRAHRELKYVVNAIKRSCLNEDSLQ